MTSKAIPIALLISVVIVVSGCTGPAPEGTGSLFLQITDQPALGIEKAEVTISKVQVHAASTGENESDDGWITVAEEPQTFDLVAIKDVKEFLGLEELAAGRYTQIRLDVDKALVTINGTAYNLTIPSETVKLVRNFEIRENQTTTLTLDFDAERSVHSTGESGKYILSPTITVVQETPSEEEQACVNSGGTVTTGTCCKSVKDFPNSCLIGACGCSPQNSHTVKICDCGEGKCFDGACRAV
jgi:hypothetical protein